MMKNKTNVPGISFVGLLLLACAFVSTNAQTPATSNPNQASTTQAQTAQAPNLQAELNLTPEQIQKWRALNKELRDQEQTANLNLREARRALADAMESPNPNEAVIKQRAKELADAQSAVTQLQALRQARVLQILTPEQRIKLKEIRERQREANQAKRREQMGQGGNQQLPRIVGRRQNGAPRNGNANPPLGLRQRKLMRPPQQPKR
jgi:Spy/CpxP family protein refolding chaperone